MRRLAFVPPLLAVVTLGADPTLPPLPIDQGAAGAWQRILKLQTTASLLHTTAHPDDEQSGLLTMASRGWGARTALLTLNRGEAGDNAIGPELFDALGLIRTDELARSAQYYGLDEQYFTAVADYGYSKRVDEAWTEWDREALLKDMVRVIRRTRPLVVVSRWQGTTRDGHGQHQASGAITPPAVEAAGDPARFPELAQEGLRPWRTPKLYLGGWRENESWHVRVDPGQYDPVVGDSYQNLGRMGLSLQRSQTAGRLNTTPGSAPLYYVRAGAPQGTARETHLLDGLDTSLPGAFRLLDVEAPPGAVDLLMAVAREARAAREGFSWTNPSASVPALAHGLLATRRARAAIAEPDVRFLLDVKERQFGDAIAAALGLHVAATAQPAGLAEPTGPFAAFAPAPTLDAVAPGQTIDVRVVVASRADVAVGVSAIEVGGPSALRAAAPVPEGLTVRATGAFSVRVPVAIPSDAPATRPYFARRSIAETRYALVDPAPEVGGYSPPAFTAAVDLVVDGVSLRHTAPVMRRESLAPYGHAMRELDVLPPVALAMSPGVLVVPADGRPHRLDVQVDATTYAAGGAAGEIALEAPAGWTVTPARQAFSLAEAGARSRLAFRVAAPALPSGQHTLKAVATSGGRTWSTGYQVIRHRDLPLRYLVRDATARVAAIDVKVRPGLHVGYVMGVGDELPAALAQLGARVTLLDRAALESGDLARFDTIMTGTRAYAVRDDLRAHNRRLLDWVRAGGNMVVLYNTQEMNPSQFAPYGGRLPGNAEEVSEQTAAVEILAPTHPFFTTPNRISTSDFDGWVEQRGSKFFTEWDVQYTALASSHDQGQAPQRGGWLTASYGRGRWTYMAYALHRQVPYGVPGAYRILANLIAPPSAR